MPVTLEWRDQNKILAELRRRLASAGQRLAAVPESAVRKGSFALQAMFKQEVPKKTSTLARSIYVRLERLATGFIGRVGTHLKYARYVEEGTGIYGPKHRPFVVRAKNAKALFWGARVSFASRLKDHRSLYRTNTTKSGVTTVAGNGTDLLFVKSVTIRGMKPRAPFSRAFGRFMPVYADITRQEVAKAVQE